MFRIDRELEINARYLCEKSTETKIDRTLPIAFPLKFATRRFRVVGEVKAALRVTDHCALSET